jgi:hypothetical protein
MKRSPARLPPAAALCIRLLLAIPGGYALVAATVAVLGAGLAWLGLARSDAVVLSAMLGFVLYLLLLLWAFAERRLSRVTSGVLGGLAFCAALLWLLTSGA